MTVTSDEAIRMFDFHTISESAGTTPRRVYIRIAVMHTDYFAAGRCVDSKTPIHPTEVRNVEICTSVSALNATWFGIRLETALVVPILSRLTYYRMGKEIIHNPVFALAPLDWQRELE